MFTPRYRFFKVYILLAIFASLLPSIALLILTYRQAIAHSKEIVNEMATAAADRAEDILDGAETILFRLAKDTGGVANQQSVTLLRRAIYNDPRFREAGIVNESGLLAATNFGLVEPPLKIPEHPRPQRDLNQPQIVGLVRTELMQELSIVISLPTNGRGAVNLLVDPVVLTGYLPTYLGDDGLIVFSKPNGEQLAALGKVPFDWSRNDSDQIQASRSVGKDEIIVTASISRADALANWQRNVWIDIFMSMLCTAAVILLMIRMGQRLTGVRQEILLGLKNQEFILCYQPIVNVLTRQCVGAEALIRWKHPEYGLISPDAFIPVAEETGVIEAITIWVIQQVILEQSLLLNQFPCLHVAINLSPAQFKSKDFASKISQILSQANISSEQVIFEITEQTLIPQNDETASFILADLRCLPSQVAVDDFGTGYSSLSYLHQFQFDYLKIDRSFMRCIDASTSATSIIDTIIEMGHKLGVKLIAEGVETEEQLQYLQARQVDFAQGWLFSRPLEIEQYKQFLLQDVSLEN